jgi:hypothetical protein
MRYGLLTPMAKPFNIFLHILLAKDFHKGCLQPDSKHDVLATLEVRRQGHFHVELLHILIQKRTKEVKVRSLNVQKIYYSIHCCSCSMFGLNNIIG